MKKRISWMLCICIGILFLAACGTDPKTVDYNGVSYEELQSYAEQNWELLQSVSVEQAQAWVEQIDGMTEKEWETAVESYDGLDLQYQLVSGWVSIADQLGGYLEEGDFTVTKSGKTTTTELELEFMTRPAVLTVVYNNLDMEVETVTIDLVYTTGEKMQKALLNTVLGMGTVFIMLIVISLIISCFRFIPVLEKKAADRKARRSREKEGPAPGVEKQPEFVPAASLGDDLELVAVIAAAIAASTGQSTDDFVVRSIRRR